MRTQHHRPDLNPSTWPSGMVYVSSGGAIYRVNEKYPDNLIGIASEKYRSDGSAFHRPAPDRLSVGAIESRLELERRFEPWLRFLSPLNFPSPLGRHPLAGGPW